MSASWYVLQTKPKQEFRAAEHLGNQNYVYFLPTLQKETVQRGRLKSVTEPLFPRYLFIRLDAANDHWAPVRSTRGVSKFVAFGERLATLPDQNVEALQQASTVVQRHLFEPGARVTIAEGPFAGWEGI